MGRFQWLLWAAVVVSAASSDWEAVLTDVRLEQAALWKEAENWVANTQGYNGKWSAELGDVQKAAQDAVVLSKGHESEIKKTIANKCPAACQTDPMTLITWQGSQDYAHLNAMKTQYKRETADLEAELHEVQTLSERFEPFMKKTNILHYKAKEEFERFEAFLSDLLAKTKDASLLRLRSSLKKTALKTRQPGQDQFKVIKEKEIGRIKMMKAACQSMEKAYTGVKETRDRIDARKSSELARYESAIKKLEDKTKKATADSDKFSDAYGGFQKICQDETSKYVDRSGDLGSLEPADLKDEFVAELDRHHLWWKTYCDDMQGVAELLQGWIASCKTAWRDSTMGAEERILDVTNSKSPTSAEDFKKATEGVCKTQEEFDSDLAAAEKKMADLGSALSGA
eukprot:gnl/MRDRNA2_/MRDRNA2_29454_c0_seq1.p1 gnl/MRDRNA2_/MRDRNA2_29454_c0~~gnl/MRDRNA2_/MRDRNA2_29454_c0_seq1.p1  ORF type:complete len:398 (-),score=109.83 gnl/MRDRNA2_/MRDRNA2_29454_c0_seq1:71-1264(-)